MMFCRAFQRSRTQLTFGHVASFSRLISRPVSYNGESSIISSMSDADSDWRTSHQAHGEQESLKPEKSHEYTFAVTVTASRPLPNVVKDNIATSVRNQVDGKVRLLDAIAPNLNLKVEREMPIYHVQEDPLR